MSSPEAWLRRQAAERPDQVALTTGGDTVTFQALDRRVDGIAETLRRHAAGNVLGTVTARADLLGLLALAAPRAQMALFPANPKLAAEQVERLFAAAGVRAAVSDDVQLNGIACLSSGQLDLVPPNPPEISSAPQRVHLIIATSGSTGLPKGTMLTGANLAAAVKASRHRIGVEPGDTWLGCMPTYHIGGLSVLFRCLEAGATILLHPRFDADAVASDLAEGRASHISLVPAMLAQLLDMHCRPSARLRSVLIGGASLPAALAERAIAAGWPICPSYGMSEAASQVATCVDGRRWEPGLAGEPLPGIEVGTSPSGRIRVRGLSVMAGYVNPTLTPGDGIDAEGWFETNDLGGVDAEGQLRVLGRADDVLISGGENIHPIEVEGLAGRCPGVQAVGITGRPDPVWGELLVAVVAGTVSAEDFLAWCRTHLPSHQRPRDMVTVDTLPFTAGGKLDRAALKRCAAGAGTPHPN